MNRHNLNRAIEQCRDFINKPGPFPHSAFTTFKLCREHFIRVDGTFLALIQEVCPKSKLTPVQQVAIDELACNREFKKLLSAARHGVKGLQNLADREARTTQLEDARHMVVVSDAPAIRVPG